jgi:predicted transposase YbfD/YdcC
MKFARPMVIIRDTFKKLDLKLESSCFPKKVLRRFVHFVEQVDDVRLAGLISYSLPTLITIAFLAVLAGANDWVEIASFAQEKRRFLMKVIPRYHAKRAPSHDTFRRVFGLIAPEQFAGAVTVFLLENMYCIKKALGIKDDGPRLISVDGKAANGTGRKYNTSQEIRNLQTLNIYDVSNGIILYSVPIEKKTNEIPTAQELLSQMEVKNSIVTFDAMNTQRETVRIICENGGDYVGGLKANQHIFHDEVALYFTDDVLKEIREEKRNYRETIEKAYNRIEKRRYYLTTDVKWFADLKRWKNLKAFVCYDIETEDLVDGKKTSERRYYISSKTDMELVADAVRGHWGIENQLHWHLDVAFEEDENATMDKNAFHNLSIINKIVLTLCKLIQPMTNRLGIKIIRKTFGWNLESELALLLSAFDENTLREAMLKAEKK